MPRVMITPHSTDPSALTALDSTLRALQGGGGLLTTKPGVFCVSDGKVFADVADAGFVCFAVPRQGYALTAERMPGGEDCTPKPTSALRHDGDLLVSRFFADRCKPVPFKA